MYIYYMWPDFEKDSTWKKSTFRENCNFSQKKSLEKYSIYLKINIWPWEHFIREKLFGMDFFFQIYNF